MRAFALDFRHVGNNVPIKLRVRQTEHLVKVVILPVLCKFFFCLVEDFQGFHVSESINFLESLCHIVNELVVEARPLHIYVV